MGKLILAVILAIALGLTFPESRAVMVEKAQPLLNPAYRWLTVQELNQVVEDLEFHQESWGDLPLGRGEFDGWMDRRYPQESSRQDAWGTRYRLQVRGDGFRVESAGPDGEFGTDDDIWREGVRTRGRIR